MPLGEMAKQKKFACTGRLLLFTGTGKGKTTAALGMMLRASGHGMKSALVSFLKSDDRCGEHRALRRSRRLAIAVTGGGFVRADADAARHRRLAERGWRLACRHLCDGSLGLVVLDEITYPIRFGWISADAVRRALRSRPPGQHVVLTGRAAPRFLAALADTVTEMREVKHAWRRGVPPARGVEW